jgi:hypothetical protein
MPHVSWYNSMRTRAGPFMRPSVSCLLALASFWAQAASSPEPTTTVVLDFQGQYSPRSLREMERELDAITKHAKLRVEWRLRGEAEGTTFDNLVVVRFKGKCILEPLGYMYDERGPLAFTYSADHVLQPFSEVACDKVTSVVRSAMWGGDYRRAELLLGRALARVVAHELVHMLSKSPDHGNTGVMKAALSGKELIAAEFRLDSGAKTATSAP